MTLFETLPHPFVWTTAKNRTAVLSNSQRPEWRRFMDEAALHFQHHEPVPPTFPAFCHDGALDEIMAAAVLAYVTRDRVYQQRIALWLRGLIAYFAGVRGKWEENLRRITRGQRPITDTPFFTENPRQFFDGFSGVNYWVEAGFMACVLHLLDLLEADAPTMLSPVEKRQVQTALAHFADRYAFHEEAVKYSNRSIWANAGVLIAGLCHADAVASSLLLEQARQRNHQLRSTFFDDGGHVEGAWAYHLMAVDALLCYTIIAEHAFGQSLSAGTSPSRTDLYAGYPSIELMVRTYVNNVIPGPIPRENPRGHGATYSHMPAQLRPSMFYAYARGHDAQLGWLIERLRDSHRDAYVSPLKVTSAAILDLGAYMPLLNFWLDGPVTNAAPLPQGLSVQPDHGSVMSRGGPAREDRSIVWAHYGFLGTAKAHRDTLHVGLSIGDQEILADPFPRTGPPGHISAIMHNTVVMDRADPPALIGQLLQHVSRPHIDAWIMRNTGGKEPGRAFMHDPRAENNYYFDVRSGESPGFFHQRAVLHFHDKALIILDMVRSEDRTPHVFDTMFHTVTPMLDIPAEEDGVDDTYRIRSFIRGEPPLEIRIPMHRITPPVKDSASFAFGGARPFKFNAWNFGRPPGLAWAKHCFPAGGPDVFALRFRQESAGFSAAYALIWDTPMGVKISALGEGRFQVRLEADVIDVDLGRAAIEFFSPGATR